MEYDFRNRTGPTYDSQIPMYSRLSNPPSSSNHPHPNPMYGTSSHYPRIGQQPGHPPVAAGRTSSSYHHPPQQPPSSASSSSGLGIMVAIKPEYQITPPPQLSPHVGDIPRSTFNFDFDFEKKILAEAEKGHFNWSRYGMDNLPPKTAGTTSSPGNATDPVVGKYMASGLSREAVSLAVAKYGDNPAKVKEFANGFTLLREMGFSSTNVAEALFIYDNDTDKALAHFLNSSS